MLVCAPHATSNSWAATSTPRRRNAAGAWTSASICAAQVLNGNHNRRSDLASTHVGAPQPSRAARCSASAARNTSRCSSSARTRRHLHQQPRPHVGSLPPVLLQELGDQPPPLRLVSIGQQRAQRRQGQRLVRRATTTGVTPQTVIHDAAPLPPALSTAQTTCIPRKLADPLAFRTPIQVPKTLPQLNERLWAGGNTMRTR